MRLKFAHDDINELTEGPFHFVNNGKPFEVANALLADELLHRKVSVAGDDGVESVNAFVPVTADDEEAPLTASGLAKFKKDELFAMANELEAGATEDNNKAEIIEKILAVTTTQED